ncbi:MAG TPA: hypothetical protein VLZ83_17055 [Edaphocola sp.]|nr:hypothetical protein [Edaphocola sp.]
MKLGLVKRIQKQITKFGLTNEELNFTKIDIQNELKTLVRIKKL